MELAESKRFHGPLFHSNGTIQFQVFAPKASSVEVELLVSEQGERRPYRHRMHREDRLSPGFFCSDHLEVPLDAHYWFVLDGDIRRPDPASHFQPEGVHGPSALVAPMRRAKVRRKGGLSTSELIVYELHIGTFTNEGTYAAAADRLVELLELGVNCIELMPLSQAAGVRNWGYDGVNWFAPNHAYGTTTELLEFLDSAHACGFTVIHDVVYNHFGPEGNYLHDFGGYVSPHHQTPWGDAPNLDGEHAHIGRSFVLANISMWLRDYGFDGLRVDALHCIADNSEKHLVTEVGEYVDRLKNKSKRKIQLIAESNIFDSEVEAPLSRGGHGFDAQWCDDFLHSSYAVLHPGEQRSSREYVPADLKTTLGRGYVYHGTVRQERERIAPDAPDGPKADRSRLIYSIQNHDFVGNHPEGKRLHQLAGKEAQQAAAALLLLGPSIPMLFMGEEFCSESPFNFFVDFQDKALREAVETGRQAEYPQFDWSTSVSPLDDEAFQRSKIGDRQKGDQQVWAWYQSLIRLRKDWQYSNLIHPRNFGVAFDEARGTYHFKYQHPLSSVFCIARLHSQPENAQPQDFEVSGKVVEFRQAKQVEAEGTRWRLSAFGVLIGTGSATPAE